MGVRSSEMKLVIVILLAGSPAFADPVTLTPVAMDGPYKSQHDACLHATPCGGTQVDAKDSFKLVKPPKVATCGEFDVNGADDDLELRGPASWFGLKSVHGAIDIIVDDTTKKPSSAGTYRFSR